MKIDYLTEQVYKPSFRNSKIVGMFDVPVEEKLTKRFEAELPIEEMEWGVGLITGPSGAGKTTIATQAFGADLFTGYEWPSDKSVVDCFKKGIKIDDITGALSHVGFSSPPAWLLPYKCLSNGQKFRADMARLICEAEKGQTLVVDEFTSVVDRTVAKISSAAVAKYARRKGVQFVAVSCHDDIADWLEPDWIYRVDTGEFSRRCLQRPSIKLEVFRCHHSAWRLFKGHHYLSADINKAAHCFIAMWGDEPVAFAAALPFPHHVVKNYWRGHRTVVLPDYQGVGIGNRLSETIAENYLEQGKRYTSLTSHPAMVQHRLRSDKWVMIRSPGQVAGTVKSGSMKTSQGRLTASFEYIGDGVGYDVKRLEKRG